MAEMTFLLRINIVYCLCPKDYFSALLSNMKKALLVYNPKSGRANSTPPNVLKKKFLAGYTVKRISPRQLGVFSPNSFDTVLVSGGDGTLSTVLAWCRNADCRVLYYPSGTFNERADALRRFGSDKLVAGLAGEDLFTYVYAAGSFTPIGYVTKIKHKQRWHGLAYLAKVLKEYRVHHLHCAIDADGAHYEDTYTLVMFLKSKCCFHFPFNRLYAPDTLSAHMLLIKAPEKDNLWGRIAMFFPFFRAFFVGFGKPVRNKKITFVPVEYVHLQADSPIHWCVDGEEKIAQNADIRFVYVTPRLEVLHSLKRKDRILYGDK